MRSKSKRLRSIAAVLSVVIAASVTGSMTSASAAPVPPPAASSPTTVATSDVAAATAYVAAVTSQCPSTDPDYYRSRDWTQCLWGAEVAWATALYKCNAGYLRVYGVQWYTGRACMDFQIVVGSTAHFGLKYWYTIDLYKVAVRDAQTQAVISYLFGLYVAVFEAYGTQILPDLSCSVAALSAGSVLGGIAAGAACGYAWSYVHDIEHR